MIWKRWSRSERPTDGESEAADLASANDTAPLAASPPVPPAPADDMPVRSPVAAAATDTGGSTLSSSTGNTGTATLAGRDPAFVAYLQDGRFDQPVSFAARRGQGDMVAGHVLGSSLFNLLVVLGIASIKRQKLVLKDQITRMRTGKPPENRQLH